MVQVGIQSVVCVICPGCAGVKACRLVCVTGSRVCGTGRNTESGVCDMSRLCRCEGLPSGLCDMQWSVWYR